MSYHQTSPLGYLANQRTSLVQALHRSDQVKHFYLSLILQSSGDSHRFLSNLRKKKRFLVFQYVIRLRETGICTSES